MAPAPIFLFIEPVNHGYKVVLAAQALGYRIAVMHALKLFAPYPYEAALNAFDIDIEVSSWKDRETLDSLIEQHLGDYRIVGTYAGAETTLEYNAQLRKRVGLPTTDPRAIRFCLNKLNVRSALREAGLSALTCLSKSDIDALSGWPFPSPMYFKPCYGGGSAKVARCESREDLSQALANWHHKDDIHVAVLREYLEYSDQYMLEQAAPGELMSVECLVRDGEVSILGLSSRTVLARNPTVEMGASFPLEHPHRRAIYEKVVAIHRVLGFSHGPTHAEVMVTQDGDVELVELNLRFAGADVLELCCRAYGHDLARELVKLGAGATPELPSGAPPRFASLQYLLPAPGTTRFDSIQFPDAVEFSRAQRPLGSPLVSTEQQIDHVGCFIVTGGDYHDLMDRASTVREVTCVNGDPLGRNPNNVVLQR